MYNMNLTPDTVMIYAVKAYEKPTYLKSELTEDMKHFTYLRRLFRRYHQYDELKERLILNHIIIVYNIFGVPAATRLLFYHIRAEDHNILKTFLVFLDYMPSVVPAINGKNILSSDLPIDEKVAGVLRKIKVSGSDYETITH